MTQSHPSLAFTDSERLGLVASVDLAHVYLNIDDDQKLNRVSVGKLIAVQGASPNEYYITLADRITRRNRLEESRRAGDESAQAKAARNKDITVRAVLIGMCRKRNDNSYYFKRGADTFPQIDSRCYVVDSANVKNLMDLLSSSFEENKRLRLGHYVMDNDAVAVADGDKFFQRHAAILGSTGTGKSWTVALILERAKELKHSNIIVLDMHGEYKSLAAGKNAYAKRFRIAGPGDLTSPKEDVLFLPYWLLSPEELLAILLDKTDENAGLQASRFTTKVYDLKERTLTALDETETKSTFSSTSPIPYALKDLTFELNDEDWEGKMSRFNARMTAKIADKLYGFMFSPPQSVNSYEWLGKQLVKLIGANGQSPGIKIIDFSEVPSEVLPIVVGIFARLLYDIQFWINPPKRTPLTIVCDEAHLYLPSRDESQHVDHFALEAFERIAKEGRKYGISLLVVSQRPADISRTILSQCGNFVILRLTNDQDQTVVRKLVPEQIADLTDILPLLDVGEALLLGDAVVLPARIKLDKPTIKPDSETLDFWSTWSKQAPDAFAIQQAVETLRRHTRSHQKFTI